MIGGPSRNSFASVLAAVFLSIVATPARAAGPYPFRGVIFDIDPEFNNTEEWWLSIPEDVRPHKDQPFYHLLAENSESEYVAYVSEQNLLPDNSGEPIRHSQVAEIFVKDKSGSYRPRNPSLN